MIVLKPRTVFFLWLLLGVLAVHVQAQEPALQLDRQIREMDSLLFDVAFNQCDLDLYKQIMSSEFEFYDDRTGLNTSRERDIQSFQDKCAKSYSVTRKLIETEIYPLKNFGAVQNGTHIFLVDGKAVEVARFTTVWEYVDGRWVVKRAISYDHRSLE
ncbi:MAG: nuclear transport factor 2 family protein [Bacteroidota bacterium]